EEHKAEQDETEEVEAGLALDVEAPEHRETVDAEPRQPVAREEQRRLAVLAEQLLVQKERRHEQRERERADGERQTPSAQRRIADDDGGQPARSHAAEERERDGGFAGHANPAARG